MNWGYRILIVYLVFVAGILFMVYQSSNQKMDLVTTDYYAKELKYQQKIDETNRVNGLPDPVTTELRGPNLLVTFPASFAGKEVNGEAVLYCPSDEDKDTKKSFRIINEPVVVPVPSLVKNEYELHLSWESGGLTYYLEKRIIIKAKNRT